MHVYIYDSFLNKKKYDNVLAGIETRLTDLGLNGKISRLGIMKNIRHAVKNELKRGAKTIIAVGNDSTINQTANAIISQNILEPAAKTIPLGIIPINEGSNNIARTLGIGFNEDACDILSARRIEKLDVGMVNNQLCFLSDAKIDSRGTILEMSKKYTIEIIDHGEINIVNLWTGDKIFAKNIKFNPRDGILELFIRTKKSKKLLSRDKEGGQSVFPLKKLTVTNSNGHPLIIDGSIETPTPAEVSVVKQGLKIIVGKERNFL